MRHCLRFSRDQVLTSIVLFAKETLSRIMHSPFLRTQVKPTLLKVNTSTLYNSGLNLSKELGKVPSGPDTAEFIFCNGTLAIETGRKSNQIGNSLIDLLLSRQNLSASIQKKSFIKTGV